MLKSTRLTVVVASSLLGCSQNADVQRTLYAVTAQGAAGAATDVSATPTVALGEPQLQLQTQPLAAVAGLYATPPADQPGLRVSTDLGWTFTHRDRIWTFFGDSWLLDLPLQTGAPDDALGSMSLHDFPDGASVDAYVAAHPAAPGDPAWRAAAPPLHYEQKPGGVGFAPMTVERDGKIIPTGTAYTPMTGFSNGRDDAAAAAFTIVLRYAPVECAADGGCNDGHVCDTGLGHDVSSEWNRCCVLGSSASCVRGTGFCQDRGTSRYNETPSGRQESVLSRLEVGLMNEADPSHFHSQAWDTRRFYNLTARTIADFDASRAGGVGNDYRPAQGNDLPQSGLFMWGRTQFAGIGSEGRDAQLYLAWVPMPQVAGDGSFAWQPRFFAGLDEAGRPLFADRELDGVPLDLDAATSGEQPQEPHDIVAQMAVTWLPNLQRFVMFYGGEMAPEFLTSVYDIDINKAQHDPQGSMYVRYAEQPWGPWTAPTQLLAAGDVSDRAPAEGLYAPGGILAHNRCVGPTCARYEPYFQFASGNNNGVLYGANIVDNWTTERADAVDLYWFVSTWNPYGVVLMKSTLTGF